MVYNGVNPQENDPVTIPTDGIEAPQAQQAQNILELSPVARCSIAAFAAVDSVCCSICGLYMRPPGFWAIARQKHVHYNVLQHITTYYKLVNGQLALL